MEINQFKKIQIDTDFCVVGGGLAGVCAAVAAARHGAKTVLIQDRPMLGGNSSSEIRMHICGAHGKNMKETGILEEIQLENYRFNPHLNFGTWDHILISFVQRQKNLTLLLNTTCNGLEMDGSSIKKIHAWQMTTQREYSVSAKYFADCSGDSVLRISGAEFRAGREAASEFNESHAPAIADNKTMGNSILIQTKELGHPVSFEKIPWAHEFEAYGFHRGLNPRDNFWWMEYGGENNTIDDAESIRDELLKIAYGVWDLMKNKSDKWPEFDIEWIGCLPGKRENIRYIGDHILTQNDVEQEGRFDDIIAYGSWSMDDHNPAAFYFKGAPTIFHPAPSPFGIPYRCLYSKNIDNLFFAGRNISCTHMAMSATRVMATCAIIGQAAGTAAAMCVRDKLSPRDIYLSKITELQNTLMDDDCYLPWKTRPISEITWKAALKTASGKNAEVLRNGADRPIGEETNTFVTDFQDSIEYTLAESSFVNEIHLVFDSNLEDIACKKMRCWYPKEGVNANLPEQLIKSFSVYVKTEDHADWKEILRCEDNYQRMVKIPVNQNVTAIRLIPVSSWGTQEARIVSFDFK